MIGAPPPNYVFAPSAKIQPHIVVKPFLYNEAGYVEHPLQQFGRAGGTAFRPNSVPAGNGAETVPGGFAWAMAGTHEIISGR